MILRTWNVGIYGWVKIVTCDLKFLARGYIWLGLISWIAFLRSWGVGVYG